MAARGLVLGLGKMAFGGNGLSWLTSMTQTILGSKWVR
jgi:hypothetical protein